MLFGMYIIVSYGFVFLMVLAEKRDVWHFSKT